MLTLNKSLANIFAPHKLVRLRRRYLFTRRERLRLRYVAGGALSAFAALTVMVGLPSPSLALKWVAPIESASALSSLPSLRADMAPSSSDNAEDQVVLLDSRAASHIQTQLSEGMRNAAAALKKPEEPKFKEIQVGQGDTIAGVLQNAGLSGNDAYYAVKALSEYFDPRTVKSGQAIGLHFERDDHEALSFSKMVMKLTPVKEVHIIKNGEMDFSSDLEEKELVQRSYGRYAPIQTSLYGSAAQAGIPQQIIAELIRIYSWNIDFQRDIRQGDSLKVLYNTYETEDGEFAQYGDILYASLTVGGREVPIFRFEMNDGRVDYFEPGGHSIRKTLMKTPIDGARMSSGFGMRKHPVLGYNKMHKGIDFAAPTGTPIYAAGDGTVEFAGRNGGFGNYVRIRHNNKLKTAYAHMHKIKNGVSVGKRVEQGQIIGYVGTTGRSTGPHLHYEVLANGAQVNPRSVKLPTGEQLAGNDLSRFKAVVGALENQYATLTEGLKFARHGDADEESENPIR